VDRIEPISPAGYVAPLVPLTREQRGMSTEALTAPSSASSGEPVTMLMPRVVDQPDATVVLPRVSR
jgi:hypothetical protein